MKHKSNNKKILIFGPTLPAVGGVATNVDLLLNSSLNQKYAFLAFDPSKKPLKGGNLFLKLLYKLKTLSKYHELLKKERPDLVHFFASAHTDFWIKSVFMLYTKALGKKMVFREGASAFDKFYRNSNTFKRWLIKIFLNLPDRLIVQSPGWKSFFKMIVPEDRITVVPNGVKLSDYNGKASLHRNLSFLKNKRIILFLGALGKRKGLYDIVRVIPFVLDHRKDTTFVFAGEAETPYEMSNITKKCERWIKMGQVYFLGNVFGEKKISLLRASCIFILPSYAEGFPNVVLEAMASGLPVVTTYVGAIPEFISEGENGFLITPGDYEKLGEMINFLLDNPSLCRKIGDDNIKKIKEKYDYKFVVKRLSEVYESVIG